ncbi:uncharacterized protein BJX67DRAFT_238771 [Aspergillus lucknowensis]|uniref:Uncharacterized protein n=1 Tax=Aspergillus lucknowensis TaxID=176173 RepID=A0ABR4LGU8_9EURO
MSAVRKVLGYDKGYSENVINSNKILVAWKLAVVDPVLHEPFRTRLSEIPIQYSTRFREAMTCRVWIKEELFHLDDEGFIKLIESIDDIEHDAIFSAMQNKVEGRQTVAKCSGTVA